MSNRPAHPAPVAPHVRRLVRGLLAAAVTACLVAAAGLVVAAPATAAAPKIPVAARSHPTLKLGSKGWAVRYVELRLGMPDANTYYGRNTRWQVAKWQRAHGLRGTGVVTAATWTKLGVRSSKPEPGTQAFGNAILGEAAKHKGKRYRYGGTGPSSFDCSGYVGYVYQKAVGKKLPRTSRQLRAATKRISRSQLRRGDLVFVHSGGRVGHVAIYGGNNTWWEATRPGRPVGKHRAWSSSVSYGRV